MRQRITFLRQPEHDFDPWSLKITDSSLTGPVLPAVREDRAVWALDELPDELRQLLEKCHELHIRWTSPYAYDNLSPLLSRLSPGLHVFYTPRAEGPEQEQEGRGVCAAIQRAFGPLDCQSPEDSFVASPKHRFSQSAAYHYYQPVESLADLVKYLVKDVCPSSDPSCKPRVARLSEASSLDVSYDTISHTVKVTALWPFLEQPLVVTTLPNYRTEVGILAADYPANLEPDELGLSGLLHVLGPSTKPSPAVFTVPSRHRRAAGSAFSAGILEPAGLHPTLKLRLSGARPPAGKHESHCSLHAYLTLPRTVFADKYQLSDSLFLASKNLSSLRYITQPVDLEAPDYVMKAWGSAALLELAPPPVGSLLYDKDGNWTAEVPLHLRYLAPAKGGYADIEVPYPVVFWACTAESGTKFPNNPFDRVHLGYDDIFGPRTVFWHVDPRPQQGQRLMNRIRVPVLDTEKSGWIRGGTAAVVLLGFAWISWKLAIVYLKMSRGSTPGKATEIKKKQ